MYCTVLHCTALHCEMAGRGGLQLQAGGIVGRRNTYKRLLGQPSPALARQFSVGVVRTKPKQLDSYV